MNIIGRLTGDAQVRTLSNEKQVVNFSLAINDNYRNSKGERVEQTTFMDCSYWISPKVADFLTKGSLVELTGRVSARAWLNKEGEARSGLNFHTSQIKLHSGGRKAETSADTPQQDKQGKPSGEDKDDLPF
ncbi:single-stranded DNA-binding protein [Flavobacterium sp.]|uniref:single-stranded DNA-binding protein n=1 Tax=Flavobacterium sp. TaxID=239 RepID=UPI003A954366